MIDGVYQKPQRHETTHNPKEKCLYVMNTSFKDGYPFLKELFAVEIEKTKIKLIKLKYLGQAISDLSKMIKKCLRQIA